MIELHTLGQFRIISNGKRLPVNKGKGAALLIYMAVNEKSLFGREQLVSVLWEDSAPPRARHSLSQTIYSLRQRVADLPLITDADSLGLETTAMRIDVARYRAALAEHRMDDALEIYTGDFLEDFWLNGAPAFEKWQGAERQKLHRSLIRGLRSQMLQAEEAGNWVNAERFARAVLDNDCLYEDAWRVLLTSRAASGDTGGAIAEYERMCALYESELDRPPSSKFSALANSLEHASPRACELAEKSDSDSSGIPFIGRSKEFQRIRNYWDRIQAGEGRTLFIIGEAGIGKTRLCRHFLRMSLLNNARILRGRCYAAESRLPYGAIVEALAEGLNPDDLTGLTPAWLSALGNLLPELLSEGFADSRQAQGEGARRRLFEAVARVLAHICEHQPLILFLDDFHWADESTTEMAHYLGRRLQKNNFLILLALRSEDVVAESRVAKLLADVEVEEHLARIQLTPLTDELSEKLIRAYADEFRLSLPVGAVGQIVSQTAGRPFFIMETLQALNKNEIELTASTDTAAGIRPNALLPASVQTLLTSRIKKFSENARRVMTVLAVLGRNSDPKLIRRVGRFPTETFLAGVDELVAQGIVQDQGTTLAFTHDLIREAAYRSLSATHQRALHARAASVLKEVDPDQSGIVAVHYDLAGNLDHAFEFCLRAANAAEKVHAYSEAEFFLRMALSNSPEDGDHYSVELQLAELLYRIRRFDEADGHYASVAAYYDSVDDSSGLLKVHTKRLSIAFNKERMPSHLLIVQINKSIDLAERHNDAEVLVELFSSLAVLAHVSGDRDLALQTAGKLKTLGIEQGNTYVGLRALTQAAKFLGIWQDLHVGIDLANEAVVNASDSEHDEAKVSAWTARATNYWQTGNLESALNDLNYAYEIAQEAALIRHVPELRSLRGVIFLEQGFYDNALNELEESLQLAKAAETKNEITVAYSNLLLLYHDLSKYDKVARIAKEILLLVEDVHWFPAVLANSMLGLCALANGNISAAKEYRREIDLRAEGRDIWIIDCSYIEMFIARMSERMGEADKAIDRLEEAIAAYENRDVLCRARMRIERARLRIKIDPLAAKKEAGEVRRQAAEWGARPLVDKADRVLDRLALHAREDR